MKFIIITNNPYVTKKFEETYELDYMDISLLQVLIKAREMVHMGHKLLSHPLSGSVKPYETPYKSIMLSQEKDKLDMESLEIMEQSIAVCEKFKMKKRTYQGETLSDFQLIDFTLIDGAVSSANN